MKAIIIVTLTMWLFVSMSPADQSPPPSPSPSPPPPANNTDVSSRNNNPPQNTYSKSGRSVAGGNTTGTGQGLGNVSGGDQNISITNNPTVYIQNHYGANSTKPWKKQKKTFFLEKATVMLFYNWKLNASKCTNSKIIKYKEEKKKTFANKFCFLVFESFLWCRISNQTRYNRLNSL